MMVFKDKNSMFVTGKGIAMSLVLFIVFLIVCSCSTARDVKPVTQLAISPDGREVVFVYQPNNGKSSLVRFNRFSRDLTSLPQPANEVWVNPVFSPDGKWLAIASFPIGTNGLAEGLNSTIDVMRPDGTGRRTVVGPNGLIKGIFSFSPDGKKILFAEGTQGRMHAVNFNVREVKLETLAISDIVIANFYRIGSLSYLADQYAYVGFSPRSYLDDQLQSPRSYLPEANDEDKQKWAMLNNSMLFVTGASPEKLTPFVRFQAFESTPSPWLEVKEIERLHVAAKTGQMFVAMRHSDYPTDKSIRHFIRDIYEIKVDKTFRRLTHFNTVRFHGFDVTPDGRYVAVVPDNSDEPDRSAACIYLLDLTSGGTAVYEPDFSKLPSSH